MMWVTVLVRIAAGCFLAALVFMVLAVILNNPGISPAIALPIWGACEVVAFAVKPHAKFE